MQEKSNNRILTPNVRTMQQEMRRIGIVGSVACGLPVDGAVKTRGRNFCLANQILYTSPLSYRAADVMNAEAVINFTIRYREDIKPGMAMTLCGSYF